MRLPERTYLKMHAWALQLGTLTDTAYIRADVANAEIERLRLELKQANAYLNDAMQKIDNLHIHIVRQDAEIERLKKALGTAGERINAQGAEIKSLKSDVMNAVRAYDTYIRMPSRGYNFRKEDAELAWMSAFNQLRERVQ